MLFLEVRVSNRKAIELYSKEGFFELQSDNPSALKIALQQHPSIEKITEENGKTLVYLNQPIEAAALNRYLFEKQIALSHLVLRKNSLEEQFLALTKNHPSTN